MTWKQFNTTEWKRKMRVNTKDGRVFSTVRRGTEANNTELVAYELATGKLWSVYYRDIASVSGASVTNDELLNMLNSIEV